MKYDFAVIGAGPAGYIAAKKAAGSGMKTLLVEKKKLGGVCLNEGCVPSKTLLQAAKTYHHAKHGSVFGVTVEGLNFDFSKAHSHKNGVMDKMRDGIAGLMKKYKVDVVEGEASLKPNRKIEINGEEHEADHILICTGSSPAVPPIPGIDQDHVVDSTGILNRETLPNRLIVVGGGVIGCEFACMYASVDVPVTVLEAMPEICPNLDGEVAGTLRKELAKKELIFNSDARSRKSERIPSVIQMGRSPRKSKETWFWSQLVAGQMFQGLGWKIWAWSFLPTESR